LQLGVRVVTWITNARSWTVLTQITTSLAINYSHIYVSTGNLP
jgi:hypothetical protein